jgi:hypothetical protein
MNILKSFFTGSRTYGTPRADSDLDLAIRVSYEELAKIVVSNVADEVIWYDNSPTASLKFGKLNVIACLTDDAFEKWALSTTSLELRAPVTRDEAIKQYKSNNVKGYSWEEE